jgi:hypothetical protein
VLAASPQVAGVAGLLVGFAGFSVGVLPVEHMSTMRADGQRVKPRRPRGRFQSESIPTCDALSNPSGHG